MDDKKEKYSPNQEIANMMKDIIGKATQQDKPVENPEEEKPQGIGDFIQDMLNTIMEEDPAAGKKLMEKLEDLAFSTYGSVSREAYLSRQRKAIEVAGATARHLNAMGNRELSFKYRVAAEKLHSIFENEVIPYMENEGKLE